MSALAFHIYNRKGKILVSKGILNKKYLLLVLIKIKLYSQYVLDLPFEEKKNYILINIPISFTS